MIVCPLRDPGRCGGEGTRVRGGQGAGDRLQGRATLVIAQLVGVTVPLIIKANTLHLDKIQVGKIWGTKLVA